MEGACPHCQSGAIVPTDEVDVRRCDACGRSSLAGPAASHSRAGAIPLRPILSGRRGRRAPGEGASWPAAIGAGVFTLGFYAILAALPRARWTELFLERGWVPYVITLVSAWALLLLLGRVARLRQEQIALRRDLIAVGAGGRLGPEEVGACLEELERRATGCEETFLVTRLERCLRHFESRRRVVESVEYLSAESNADEGRVDASYALVRVFVWAVPTLGFIGTVLGIAAAVGGFSETLGAAASLEGMKESIGAVTGGLGVAFDTTLLALVMSILIMFPASAVQRREETLLGEVDDYCAELFVRRLRDEPDQEVDEATIEALVQRVAAAVVATESGGP
jgi:biopolymer transport protein ExbB/TolQ